jgi:hypothetical protein
MSRTLSSLLASLLLTACASSAAEPPATPEEHRRGPEQTFLTFPEWYLVHSPAEYATYLQTGKPPSAFPLFAHIGQFWQSYAAVNREIRKYPFNGGYHLMVCVIGVSTTAEYGLKGLYERTVGRIGEAFGAGSAITPEEKFAARVAQEYVDFIRYDPWYLFDFTARLKALWTDVPLGGPNTLRRWERRYALTTEYLVKAAYGKVIKLGTQTLYDAPKPVTAIVIDRAPAADATAGLPDFKVLRALTDHAVLATIPRYEGFTTYARGLALSAIGFSEVAGNRGEIVLSAIAADTWRAPEPAYRTLFTQPILTRPGQQRVVMALPIAKLADAMRLEGPALHVEHVYDF